jgi:hypothetical protein
MQPFLCRLEPSEGSRKPLVVFRYAPGSSMAKG